MTPNENDPGSAGTPTGIRKNLTNPHEGEDLVAHHTPDSHQIAKGYLIAVPVALVLFGLTYGLVYGLLTALVTWGWHAG